MPRDGALTFGDLDGKLDLLRVACRKCDRRGQYTGAISSWSIGAAS